MFFFIYLFDRPRDLGIVLGIFDFDLTSIIRFSRTFLLDRLILVDNLLRMLTDGFGDVLYNKHVQHVDRNGTIFRDTLSQCMISELKVR